ncbi:hypothetical protein HFO15_27335 [Rhizobium laguerreae]|uniref:hypothetical protein n=1 Tax=Rhizobium laguerreae TaxID=1076926 RepID=UPI001C8FB7D8|nr:hypothetical protein [Rhizobium laguerreae]MBY3265319.1 hypothetical protein [Rhizobium laguerreae]MBY3337760.1 hypothetical protein [Rhizobium laguerreae]
MAIAAAVWLVIPRPGELIIRMRPEVKDPEFRSKAIVRGANYLAQRRAGLAGELTEVFGAKKLIVGLEESPGSKQLQDFVNASIGIKLRDDVFDSSFGINLVAPLQDLIIRLFSSDRAAQLFIDDWKAEPGGFKLGVSLLNGTGRYFGPEIDENMAMLKVAAYLDEELYSLWVDCAQAICARDAPRTEEDIRTLINVIVALGPLSNAGVCEAISDQEDCIRKMREQLRSMADMREGGAATHFSLFILELRQLQLALRGDQTTALMAQAMDEAYSRLQRARNRGGFFERMIGSQQELDAFLVRNDFGDVQITSQFLADYSNLMQGRRAMQRADYQRASEMFQPVEKSSPPWFREYVSAFYSLAQAELNISDFDAAMKFVNRYQTIEKPLFAPNIWGAFKGRSYQLLAERFYGRLSDDQRATLKREADGVWLRTMGLQKAEFDLLGIEVERERTLYAFGESQAAQKIEKLARRIEPHHGDKNWRMALMSLASWSALTVNTENKDRVWKRIEGAVIADPQNLCVVRVHRDFDELKNSDQEYFQRQLSKLAGSYNVKCS